MSLSCPSRVQSLTGQYNYRNYVAFGYMNPDENTFAHLAKTAGYNTAMVGKWQLGKDRTLPTKCGFDEFCLFQLESYKERSERYANAIVDRNGEYIGSDSVSSYGPKMFQDYAFDFIDRSARAGKPFLLYYTTPLVHAPFTPTPDSESWDIATDSEKPDTANFAGMIAFLDKQVGEMIAKLKCDGLYDNTIIIFTADNGTSTKIHTPMKDGTIIQGGKGEMTDRGTHVPLIITWGDKCAKGVESRRLVDLTDFMPTFADAMGVEVPAQWTIDGISLYPEISGGEPLVREWTLCHFNPLWPTVETQNASRTVRDAQHKLYHDGCFYDVETDVLEQNSIAKSEGGEIAEQTRTKFQAVLDALPRWNRATRGNLVVEHTARSMTRQSLIRFFNLFH